MSGAVARLDQALYAGIERNWDDSLLRDRILAALTPGSVVLDLGAGYELTTNKTFSVVAPVMGILLTVLFWTVILAK